MKNVSIKQIKLLVAAAVATLILVVGGYFLYDTLTFRITNQDPSNNASFPSSATIAITFNKPLAAIEKQRVSLSPNVGGEWQVKGRTLYFQPYNILDNISYTVDLKEVTATNNMKLNHSFSFTASSELDFTEDQQQRAIEQTDAVTEKYSVLEKNVVPYRDSNYVIEYEFPTGEEEKMILKISFTPPEYIFEDPVEYQKFVDENAEIARQYLVSQGIKLDEYRIDIINQYQ